MKHVRNWGPFLNMFYFTVTRWLSFMARFPFHWNLSNRVRCIIALLQSSNRIVCLKMLSHQHFWGSVSACIPPACYYLGAKSCLGNALLSTPTHLSFGLVDTRSTHYLLPKAHPQCLCEICLSLVAVQVQSSPKASFFISCLESPLDYLEYKTLWCALIFFFTSKALWGCIEYACNNHVCRWIWSRQNSLKIVFVFPGRGW